MQIGRVAGLREPLDVSEDGSAGVELSLLVTPVQARQLLDMVDNQGERQVPVVVDSDSSLDGLYRLVGVDASRDAGLQHAGLSQVSVSLVQVQGGRQVANSQLLVRGDNRDRVASVGLWGPLYRVGLPGGAGAVSSLSVGPGGFRAGGGLFRSGAITLASGENLPLTAVGDGTDMYVPIANSPSEVVKIDLSTFTRTSAITLSSGEDLANAVAVDGTDLYVATLTNPIQVIKIDLSTFTRTGAITLNAGEGSASALAVSGTDLYVLARTIPSQVIKIDLSTFTRTAAITLNSGENLGEALAVSGTDLYVAAGGNPGSIVKIDLSTFTRTGAITLNAGETFPEALVVSGTDLYVATGDTPARVVKINLSTFTRTGAITLNAGEDIAGRLAVVGTDLYVSTSTLPGRIVKVDLSTFTRTGAITFNTGEDRGQAIVVESGQLYVPTFTSPARIVKVTPLANPSGLRGSFLPISDNTRFATAIYVTTANRTLSGLTSSGISGGSTPTAGQVVLVAAQTTASENGLYAAASGAWTRVSGFATDDELNGVAVNVTTAASGATGVYMISTVGTTKNVARRPAFGLRDSDNGGPVSFGFDLPLADYYTAACTVTDNGTTITGTRAPAQDDLRIDNGLVRVRTVAGQLTFEFAAPGDTTWDNVYTLDDDFGGAGEINTLYQPSIVVNSPEECALRYRFDAGDSSGTLDVSIQRGSRTANLAITHSSARLSRLTFTAGGSSVTMTGLSGSGDGYSGSPDRHIVYENADNSEGHRVGASYQGELDSNLISDSSARTHVWGVHAVIGGGAAATTPDGIYGLDRTWYAMMSSTQSAGIV